MKKILEFDENSYRAACNIVKKLRDNGFSAYFVGGCVRDALLGSYPDEVDITTNARPEKVRGLFERTVAIGESFGVILVIEDGISFEVATFRSENEYSDGRHPDSVVYSDDEKEDVLRRDFTINGILYDPFTSEIFDYVEGLNDIKNRTVKTIGDPFRRFDEDKLRMIRAIRFANRFNFKIEENTYKAIESMADRISVISVERVRDEIIKIITGPNPGNGIRSLLKSGLLVEILPEVSEMDGIKQPPEFHPEGDVFIHTCLVLDILHENTSGNYSPELAMGALLHDIGKPPTYQELDRIRFNGHDRVGARMAKSICQRLRFSKKQTGRIVDLVNDHLKFKDVTNMRESTLKRFMSIPYFEEHLEMHRADCMASHGMLNAYEFVKLKKHEYGKEEIKPTPLISGRDLIRIGYKPGPIFKKILEDVESLQLEKKLESKEEAEEFVIKTYDKEAG